MEFQEFQVGDMVFICTNQYDEYLKEKCDIESGGSWESQFAFAKHSQLPLMIVWVEKYGDSDFDIYLACSEESWWGSDQGQKFEGNDVKTWIAGPEDIIKIADGNTISLYELNRGL